MGRQNTIDWQITVAVLVAVRTEMTMVRSVLEASGTSLVSGSAETNIDQYFITSGTVLVRVLLAKTPPPAQGGDAASWLVANLAGRYKLDFIIMVGLSAGNPKVVELGDVIVATSVARHDYGKLTKRRGPKTTCPYLAGSVDFEPRSEPLHIDHELNGLLHKLLPTEFEVIGLEAQQAHSSQVRVVLGALTSGNQVTKLRGFFRYLIKHHQMPRAGDEDARTLVGLDMEAYSVAYIAKHCRIPWLVVKGVCDYADDKKDDAAREPAVVNATEVALYVIRCIATTLYPAPDARADALDAERLAQMQFDQGNLDATQIAATRAHAAGRRSRVARRRYVMALTAHGRYNEALAVLTNYHETGILNDDLTAELLATLYLRRGDYSAARSAIAEVGAGASRQLTYLSAVNEVLATDGANRATLLAAGRSLNQALSTPGLSDAWWIAVNYYWVLRLLKARPAILEAARQDAQNRLARAIRVIGRGAPRLYMLFLLAIADDRTTFDDAVKHLSRDVRHVEVPLELVDLVYARMQITIRVCKPNRTDYDHYWARMCEWVQSSKALGSVIRPETGGAMQ